MKIINDENKILDSTVSFENYDDLFGLVLESRGGAQNKPFERNRDYLIALDTILERLKKLKVKSIQILLVSKPALDKSKKERIVTVDEKSEIDIRNYDPLKLRKKITSALAAKRDNPNSKGGNPTKRILISANLDSNEWEKIVNNNSNYILQDYNYLNTEITDIFDPTSVKDAVDKTLRSISVRRGQFKFRKDLLKIYDGKCAITDSTVLPVLQAAHIYPYKGKDTNHLTNGILLRSDIHDLFDMALIGIDTDYKVVVSQLLDNTEYSIYNGKIIHLPLEIKNQPSKESLKLRPLPYRKE